MLEIRGIGIIDVTQMFGVRAFFETEQIDFVIEFEPWDNNRQYLRAGVEEQLFYEALGVKFLRLFSRLKRDVT